MKIGDSIKLKDGRKFKVVSKDNRYFVLKDSKGKVVKMKDERFGEVGSIIQDIKDLFKNCPLPDYYTSDEALLKFYEKNYINYFKSHFDSNKIQYVKTLPATTSQYGHQVMFNVTDNIKMLVDILLDFDEVNGMGEDGAILKVIARTYETKPYQNKPELHLLSEEELFNGISTAHLDDEDLMEYEESGALVLRPEKENYGKVTDSIKNMKIGDSVKLKDGRKFKVVSKDNGYLVLKDSNGKMARIKDSKYSEEAMEAAEKLRDFALDLSRIFDGAYRNCFHELAQKYHLYEDEETKEMYSKIQKYYNKIHYLMLKFGDLVAQKIDGLRPVADSAKALKDSTYTPQEMLSYLAQISWDFSVPMSEIVEGVRKMLKDIELTEEYLEMNGSNEKMNAEILEFITNNPDFDWNSVTI